MNADEIDVQHTEVKGAELSKAMEHVAEGDRVVFLEPGFTIKGEVTKKFDKNGTDHIVITPDKSNGIKPIEVALTEQNSKRLDGLYSVNDAGEKKPRQFAYLEVKQLMDQKRFGSLAAKDIMGSVGSLMQGNKTEVLKDVTFSYDNGETTNKEVRDARFELRRNNKGQIAVKAHKALPEYDLSKPFYGREFTQDEKKKLHTDGELGLKEFVNKESGELYNMWVGLDKELKRPMARPEWAINKDKIYGVALTDSQKKDWQAGNAVVLDKNNKTKVYQASASSRKLSGIKDFSLEQAQKKGLVATPDKDATKSQKEDKKQSKGVSR